MLVNLKYYQLGEQTKENEMDGTIARIMKKVKAYRILVWKPEGKRQLDVDQMQLKGFVIINSTVLTRWFVQLLTILYVVKSFL
jgi:hypothetical protein